VGRDIGPKAWPGGMLGPESRQPDQFAVNVGGVRDQGIGEAGSQSSPHVWVQRAMRSQLRAPVIRRVAIILSAATGEIPGSTTQTIGRQVSPSGTVRKPRTRL
jgi:hypothetical protein